VMRASGARCNRAHPRQARDPLNRAIDHACAPFSTSRTRRRAHRQHDDRSRGCPPAATLQLAIVYARSRSRVANAPLTAPGTNVVHGTELEDSSGATAPTLRESLICGTVESDGRCGITALRVRPSPCVSDCQLCAAIASMSPRARRQPRLAFHGGSTARQDVVVVMSLATDCGYELGFPLAGDWGKSQRDVYDNWVTLVAGNDGRWWRMVLRCTACRRQEGCHPGEFDSWVRADGL
jgi:hypothetical protein